MSTGLFSLSCPECGEELEVDHLGAASCAGCGHSYLSRFGHLMLVDDSLPAADGAVDGGAAPASQAARMRT